MMQKIYIWFGPKIQCTARLANGWLLAECTMNMDVSGVNWTNGGSDGTDLGRKYYAILSDALLTGKTELPTTMDET